MGALTLAHYPITSHPHLVKPALAKLHKPATAMPSNARTPLPCHKDGQKDVIVPRFGTNLTSTNSPCLLQFSSFLEVRGVPLFGHLPAHDTTAAHSGRQRPEQEIRDQVTLIRHYRHPLPCLQRRYSRHQDAASVDASEAITSYPLWSECGWQLHKLCVCLKSLKPTVIEAKI